MRLLHGNESSARATRSIGVAASGALAKQIESGAPADIFVSADLKWMNYAAEKKLIKPETRATLLGNDPIGYLRSYAIFAQADEELAKDVGRIDVPTLIVAAAALLGAAFAASRRQQVVVELDEAGYRVDSPAGVRAGTWKDATRVTTAPGRITLHQGADERVHLVAPQGQLPEFDAIVKAVSEHLDADRGYTVWEG